MKRFRIIAIVSLLVCIVGCTSEEALRQEVQAARTKAYQQWQRDRQKQREMETQISGRLSLVDAVKLAMTNSKPLLSVIEEKEIAQGRILESYSLVLPSLSANADYTRLDRPQTITFNGNTITLGARDNYSANLQVTQPVFRGGAIIAGLRAARIFSYLTDERIRGAVQQTVLDTSRAYYDTLLAQELYRVNHDAVISAEAHYKDVKNRHEQGVASQYDLLQAQVNVSLFTAEMIRQRNRVNIFKTRLLKVMGVSQNNEIELSDKLMYEPYKPVLEKAMRLALEKRPDLYTTELNVRLQQEALIVAKSTYWPQVSAFFTQEWTKPDPHDPTNNEWGNAWSTGIQMSYPLFDGFGREGRVMAEKARLKQSNYELMDAEERAVLEIHQTIVSIRDAEEFVQSQKLNLDAAIEGLRLAEVGFNEGVNTEVDVIEARSAKTRTEGLYYQAMYDHMIARLELERAMGILGPQNEDTAASKSMTKAEIK
jgi:outer membrane protein